MSAAELTVDDRLVRTPTPALDALQALPSGWRRERLKYHVRLNPEALSEGTPPDQRISYIDISSVSRGGRIGSSQELDFVDAPSRARRVVRARDTIVSTVRTYLRAVAWIPDVMDGFICSTGFAVLRPLESLDPAFLYYWASATPFIEEVAARSAGVSYPAINASEVVEIIFPLPPLKEQRAIASTVARELDAIDSVAARKQRLLALLAERERAFTDGLLHGVQDPIESGAVPPDWRVMRLKYCVESIDQGWSPECENRPAEPDEWGVLKIACVNGRRFDPSENKALPASLDPPRHLEAKPGDVLLSRGNTRELVAKAALVHATRPKLLLSDLLYRVRARPDVIEPAFLAYSLSTQRARFHFEREARGSSGSMPKVSQATVLNLPILVPPIREQRDLLARIETKASEAEALERNLKGQLGLLREHRDTVIFSAVTGRLQG